MGTWQGQQEWLGTHFENGESADWALPGGEPSSGNYKELSRTK